MQTQRRQSRMPQVECRSNTIGIARQALPPPEFAIGSPPPSRRGFAGLRPRRRASPAATVARSCNLAARTACRAGHWQHALRAGLGMCVDTHRDAPPATPGPARSAHDKGGSCHDRPRRRTRNAATVIQGAARGHARPPAASRPAAAGRCPAPPKAPRVRAPAARSAERARARHTRHATAPPHLLAEDVGSIEHPSRAPHALTPLLSSCALLSPLLSKKARCKPELFFEVSGTSNYNR